MSAQKIQIIAFNNPYPANFGGAIDMFYKVKAFHKLDVKVYLHIFYDERNDVSGIENFCEEIYLYKRDKGLLKHFSLKPFSTNSRKNKELIKRLKASEVPILIESLRSCSILISEKFSQKVAIRNHNIEHNYSFGLSKSENNIIQKIAQYIEGVKQKRFENILNKADVLFNISNHEQTYFKDKYNPESVFLPVFQGYETIKSKSGFGKYALYHGDLTTADNLKSALFLIRVFKGMDIPFVIAGSGLPSVIQSQIKDIDSISYVQIKDYNHLQKLIENAHINALYSFQESGTKLKVFTALFNGRHCILNKNMVDDKAILNCCEVAETEIEYRNKVKKLFKKEFKITDDRKQALLKYNDVENAKIIVENLL